MGIRNLLALKPWDQPSDYGYDTSDSEWRSVGLDVSIEITEDDKRYAFLDETVYLLDEAGDFFFVQLEGYEEGETDLTLAAVSDEDEDISINTGFLCVVSANDESQYSLSEVPLGAYAFVNAIELVDVDGMIDTYASNGIAIEIASTFGAVFDVDVPGHFVSGGGFRSVALDIAVEVAEDDRRFSTVGSIGYVEDEDGDFFFVQLSGYDNDAGESIGAVGAANTGYLAIVSFNDESTYSLEDVPVGCYLILSEGTMQEATDDIAFMDVEEGVGSSIATTFGAVFEVGVPGHFETNE